MERESSPFAGHTTWPTITGTCSNEKHYMSLIGCRLSWSGEVSWDTSCWILIRNWKIRNCPAPTCTTVSFRKNKWQTVQLMPFVSVYLWWEITHYCLYLLHLWQLHASPQWSHSGLQTGKTCRLFCYSFCWILVFVMDCERSFFPSNADRPHM